MDGAAHAVVQNLDASLDGEMDPMSLRP